MLTTAFGMEGLLRAFPEEWFQLEPDLQRLSLSGTKLSSKSQKTQV